MIEKLHLGEPYETWGMEEPEYSIERRLDETESHHSRINEEKLYEMFEEIENKINEIIERINNLSSQGG